MAMMDNYPPNILSTCTGQSIFERCGKDCPIYIAGNCPIEDEIEEANDD